MALFHVMHAGQEIGASDLEHHDPSMGIVHGKFRPTPAYEHLRSVFQLFAQATVLTPENSALLQEYYRQRDALRLSLRTDSGQSVETSAIHVHDQSLTRKPDEYELEVGLQDAASYERYFSNK